MNDTMKKYVRSLLERYPETIRKIALLRYEMEHPASITPEEMIDAMAFSRGEGGGTVGRISNKTLYIAMNYQSMAARLNGENMDEIARRLLPLEREVERLTHYVALLPRRDSYIIRRHYFEDASWEEIAGELDIAVRTAQVTLKASIARLAEMYQFVAESE